MCNGLIFAKNIGRHIHGVCNSIFIDFTNIIQNCCCLKKQRKSSRPYANIWINPLNASLSFAYKYTGTIWKFSINSNILHKMKLALFLGIVAVSICMAASTVTSGSCESCSANCASASGVGSGPVISLGTVSTSCSNNCPDDCYCTSSFKVGSRDCRVCGSDGRTYPCMEELNRNKVVNPGWYSQYMKIIQIIIFFSYILLGLCCLGQGPCSCSAALTESQCNDLVRNTATNDQVCGSDGKTYSHNCQIDLQRCSSNPKACLYVKHGGPCTALTA